MWPMACFQCRLSSCMVIKVELLTEYAMCHKLHLNGFLQCYFEHGLDFEFRKFFVTNFPIESPFFILHCSWRRQILSKYMSSQYNRKPFWDLVLA